MASGLLTTFCTSASRSQLRLSRKPKRSVVSEGEKRSADDGNGVGDWKRLWRAGSKEKLKSSYGPGGWRGLAIGSAVEDEECSRL